MKTADAQAPTPNFRIGTGYDVHRLVTGRKLILGGVQIPSELGSLGHSDGDALTHAIADAILGALALGDIGRHFPDDDPQYAGSDSIELLKQVVALAGEKDYALLNVDATVILQQPKLKSFMTDMRKCLARALGIDPGQISVKATTTEGLGMTGSGEAVAAQAVCLLAKSI